MVTFPPEYLIWTPVWTPLWGGEPPEVKCVCILPLSLMADRCTSLGATASSRSGGVVTVGSFWPDSRPSEPCHSLRRWGPSSPSLSLSWQP